MSTHCSITNKCGITKDCHCLHCDTQREHARQRASIRKQRDPIGYRTRLNLACRRYRAKHPYTYRKNRLCKTSGKSAITRGCPCENCVRRRQEEKAAKQRWKLKDPIGFAQYRRGIGQRQRAKKKAANPEAYHTTKYESNKQYRLIHYKKWRARLSQLNYHKKAMVFWFYGNECVCCGERTFEFLSIDHKNNDGKAHRARTKAGQQFWSDIIRQGCPSDMQVLCFNCNCARALNKGICPHQNTTAIVPYLNG